MIKTNLTSSIGKEPEHLKPVIYIKPSRRDGKYPVTIIRPGAPNAFGGYYPSRTEKRILPLEKLREYTSKPNIYDIVDHAQGTWKAAV